jgi:hypothetical protein
VSTIKASIRMPRDCDLEKILRSHAGCTTRDEQNKLDRAALMFAATAN